MATATISVVSPAEVDLTAVRYGLGSVECEVTARLLGAELVTLAHSADQRQPR